MNSLLAGDVGVVVEIGPIATGSVDGTTITSALLRVLGPLGGPASDWANTLINPSVTAITVQHVTTGLLTLQPGEYIGRIFLYVGSSIVISTEEFTFTVRPARIRYPS